MSARVSTLTVALVSILMSAAASAQVALVPVAGYLTTSSGSPVDGNVTLDVSIYGAATGGTPLHAETGIVVDVDRGWFTVHLGATDPLNLGIFDGSRRFLELKLDGELPMAPRIEFETTAFAAYARSAGAVPWSGITGVPPSIADGDADTTYTAAGPIVLTATTFGLDSTGCSAGEGWIWTGTAWDCAPATGTTYSAGSGLSLDGTTFSVDTSVVQARVTASCPPGQAIRAIGATGAVTCEVDDDTSTTYTAGNGLSLSGTEFAIDPLAAQVRVTGTCPAGQSIRAIASDGTVTCEQDDGENYTGGLGITMGATSIAINPAEAQRRISATCPIGEAIRVVNEDGTVGCQPDTDTDTTYSAGTGLVMTGTTFAVNTTLIQARVTGTCLAGQKMLGVNADGSVVCGTDIDTDTNTTYAAGSGLSLVGTTFSADTSVVQARVSDTCTGSQYVQAITAAGGVVCGTPVDTNSGGDITSVTAGTGLTGGGDTGPVTLNVDTGAIQARVGGTCPVGQGIRGIDANGGVTCDSGQSRNTTAEMLLRSQMFMTGGGIISWSAATERLSWTDRIIAIGSLPSSANTSHHMDLDPPPVGTVVTGVGTGDQTWQADGIYIAPWTALYYFMPSGTTTQRPNSAQWRLVAYPAAAEILPAEWLLVAFRNGDSPAPVSSSIYEGGGEMFVNTDGGIALRLGQTYRTDRGYQPLVTGSCPAGSSIRAIDINGGVTCEVDDDTDTNTTYSNGAGLLLGGTTFSIDQNYVQRRPVRECPSGYATFYADGNVRCRAEVGDWSNVEWPDNLGGGGGDDAWIRHYSQGGENMILHIGIANDADDDIYLDATGPITSYSRQLNHIAADNYNQMSAVAFNQIDLQRADGRKFLRFGDQGDIINTCGGTWGGGNHQVNMANWDLAGGCGDAHGFAIWNHGGERIDFITFARNDGDDWNVSIGGANQHYTGGWAGFDIAEFVPMPDGDWDFGDIVALDAQHPGMAVVGDGDDELTVVGVIAESPGIYMMGGWVQVGGRQLTREGLMDDAQHLLDLTEAWGTEEEIARVRPTLERIFTGESAPVALAGRVEVRVTGENGPIRIGDAIAMSTVDRGAGARSIGPAQTIGVAMSAFDGRTAGDVGKVEVFLARQDTRGLDAGLHIGVDPGVVTDLSDQLDAERARTDDLEVELAQIRAELNSLRQMLVQGGIGVAQPAQPTLPTPVVAPQPTTSAPTVSGRGFLRSITTP